MTWVAKNDYLTRSEMINNAGLFYSFFKGRGWTDKAIAATLGNVEHESGVNPGRWQNGKPYGSSGYGLVQWTPYTKYSRWAGSDWLNNGVKQCQRIEWEWRNNQQWIKNMPMSFDDYVHNTSSNLSYLTEVWMRNYERPGNPQLEKRIAYAYKWYEWITGVQPDPEDPYPDPPPDPGDLPSSAFLGVNLWYILKANQKRKEWRKWRSRV